MPRIQTSPILGKTSGIENFPHFYSGKTPLDFSKELYKESRAANKNTCHFSREATERNHVQKPNYGHFTKFPKKLPIIAFL